MNEFGKEFMVLTQAYQEFPYFQSSVCYVKGRRFVVVECNAPKELLNNCVKIARKKCQFTMNAGQDEIQREEKLKEINQFKGILAEMAIQLYIHFRCKVPFSQITRWDLERQSFAYSVSEYDLCFQSDAGTKFIIESRSSSSYKSDLKKFMAFNDIIGPYTNALKRQEKESDLYVRPVYQYQSVMSEKEYHERVLNTYDDIKSGSLKLYLTAAASRDDMFGPSGYEKNMRQGNTSYRCIKIADAKDIRYVDAWVKEKRRR